MSWRPFRRNRRGVSEGERLSREAAGGFTAGVLGDVNPMTGWKTGMLRLQQYGLDLNAYRSKILLKRAEVQKHLDTYNELYDKNKAIVDKAHSVKTEKSIVDAATEARDVADRERNALNVLLQDLQKLIDDKAALKADYKKNNKGRDDPGFTAAKPGKRQMAAYYTGRVLRHAIPAAGIGGLGYALNGGSSDGDGDGIVKFKDWDPVLKQQLVRDPNTNEYYLVTIDKDVYSLQPLNLGVKQDAYGNTYDAKGKLIQKGDKSQGTSIFKRNAKALGITDADEMGRSNTVAKLQSQLIDMGLLEPGSADGLLGFNTINALRALKQISGGGINSKHTGLDTRAYIVDMFDR